MFNNADHPHVTLSDWQAFKVAEVARRSVVAEVIDRDGVYCLPEWFVPLARGVAIASDALLQRAGRGRKYPHGWRKIDPHCCRQLTGGEGAHWPDLLIVRECDKHDWWAIQRRVADVDQVLVLDFGSTPIFTRSSASAKRLAEYCNENTPAGLRWAKEAADDCSGAIAFARQRRDVESVGLDIAQVERLIAH
jgi:hypothetical protein